MARLMDLARTIRSKNAGPDCITFDIIFSDDAVYREVKQSGAADGGDGGRSVRHRAGPRP